MVTGTQNLIEEFDQLTTFLEQHPDITLLNTEGQPPDSFEIEYSFPGYSKQADGTIQVADIHRIRINIPFGYPHFAPTVKPLTPIFHPEIDPDAVRIADLWQNNPSLQKLVLHIASMISGNTFNLDDPFNPEASEWYRNHASEFPLINQEKISLTNDPIKDGNTLDEDIFTSLTLDDGLSPADQQFSTEQIHQPEIHQFTPAQIDHARSLVSEKKLFEAYHVLSTQHQAEQLDNDQAVLLQGITHQLEKADEIYSLAQQLEEVGKPVEALDCMENLFNIAIDIPGTDEIRERLEMAASLLPNTSKGQLTQATKVKSPESKPLGNKEQKKTKTIRPKNNRIVELGDFLSRIPVKSILLLLALLSACFAATSFYFKDNRTISATETAVLKGRIMMNKGQFEQAQEHLNATKRDLSSLTVLRFKKNTLEDQIDQILTSKTLQEGLKGNILYKGKYYPIQTAQALRELSVLTTQAEKLRNENQTASALTMYRQAQNFSLENDLNEQATILEKEVKSLELETTLSKARNAEISHDWKSAEETYRKALKLSGSLSDPKTANIITARLTAASFRHELDQSKQSFTREQWKETISKLEHAKELIDSKPGVVSAKEQQDLNRLLVNARLYNTLSEAKILFHQNEWDKALENYSKALALLEAESLNFEGLLDDSIYKIKRTMLMVRIAQIQDRVFIAEKNRDTEEIIQNSKDILRLIQSSSMGKDPAISEVFDKVSQQLSIHEKKLAMDEKVNWLIANYKEIFNKYYPTFEGSELLSPKVTLLREEGNTTIFTITCIEKSKGSASRLELNYIHNDATNSWSVYTGD